MCVALAGACGLRAFLPLFYFCVAVRTGLFSRSSVNPQLLDIVDVEHSTVLLVALGSLALLEMAAEKILKVAEKLELLFLLCRLLAGIILAFAVVRLRDLGLEITAAMVTGVIGVVPVLNLQVRENASDGARLPGHVLVCSSLMLDAICLLVVAVALQAPYVALGILYVATWVGSYMVGQWKLRLREEANLRALPTAPELPPDWIGSRSGRDC